MSWDKPFQGTSTIANAPCVSLFTRHGRVGCSTSDRATSKGFLVHASTLLAAMTSSSSSSSQQTWFIPPLVLVLNEDELGYSTIENWKLKLDYLIQGILVLSQQPNATQITYSPASPTPFSSSYSWNPWGDDLLQQDLYGIPIFYITDTNKLNDIETVAIQQASKLISYNSQSPYNNNNGIQELVDWQDTSLYPAMVAELDLYMGSAVMDSPTCLGWKDQDPTHAWNPKCLPIGGNSVWAFLSQQQQQQKPTILVSTNMDATSMFHDVVPGANTAASNILVLLMTARLLGQEQQGNSFSWDSTLTKQVVFASFQGESFGRIGSMSFLQDVFYPGFQCDTVSLVEQKSTPHGDHPPKACLYPLRQDMTFTSLTSNGIDSMIALDQLGLLENQNTFYLHDNNANNGDSSTTTTQDWKYIFQYLSSYDDEWNVEESSVQEFPPSGPFVSLNQLSGANVGGVVFTGYDTSFVKTSHYMSHVDSNATRPLDVTTLAKASTFLARAILAYATLDSNNKYYQKAVQYAIQTIPQLNVTDTHFLELSHCLLEDGFCDLFLKYGKMQQANTFAETGVDLGLGIALGNPPNYYPSIYDASNGQAFVQISGKWYGSFKSNNTADVDFGKDKTDTFLIRPNLLEISVHGLFNDYLGRNGSDTSLKTCKNSLDCTNVPYCSSSISSGGFATCSGTQVCVCSRAHYHPAVDPALVPSPNNNPGYFIVSNDDTGNTLMFTEPYWSNSIGVIIYRDSSPIVDYWVLGAGFMVGILSVVAVLSLKRRMKKEKLY